MVPKYGGRETKIARPADHLVHYVLDARYPPYRLLDGASLLRFPHAAAQGDDELAGADVGCERPRVFASLGKGEPHTSWIRRASLATVAPESRLLFGAVFGE